MGASMNLSAPTFWVFIVSVILAAVGILSMFVFIPWVSESLVRGFWILAAGYVLLLAGNVTKGL